MTDCKTIQQSPLKMYISKWPELFKSDLTGEHTRTFFVIKNYEWLIYSGNAISNFGFYESLKISTLNSGT